MWRTILMRVVRIYHAGRDAAHRARERALVASGADVTLVVPRQWRESGAEQRVSSERFEVVELPVRRSPDVQRHYYRDENALRRVVERARPDVVDVHEEAPSVAARQCLRVIPPGVPAVMYAAQNIDKRYPPPFCVYERSAFHRVAAFYPCSRQAASVLRGKGFAGLIEVLPLGYDETLFEFGRQSLDSSELVLMLVGRLITEKGVADAVRIVAHIQQLRRARLLVIGEGPQEQAARELAASLGIAEQVEFRGWRPAAELASAYRRAHIVLVPSRPSTVAEQFGRVIVEAQASGAVVAGYDCGAVAEVAGEAGVIVPVGDVTALAERVSSLLGDRQAFERRREAGRRQALARTWQVVAARQMEVYRRAKAGVGARVLPRSPRRRRELARGEFGPTAAASGGVRPFAMAPLRGGGRYGELLARIIDGSAELRATLPS